MTYEKPSPQLMEPEERFEEIAEIFAERFFNIKAKDSKGNERENGGSRPEFPQTCHKAGWPEGGRAARTAELTGLQSHEERSSLQQNVKNRGVNNEC